MFQIHTNGMKIICARALISVIMQLDLIVGFLLIENNCYVIKS